jgi:hypothetical protein
MRSLRATSRLRYACTLVRPWLYAPGNAGMLAVHQDPLCTYTMRLRRGPSSWWGFGAAARRRVPLVRFAAIVAQCNVERALELTCAGARSHVAGPAEIASRSLRRSSRERLYPRWVLCSPVLGYELTQLGSLRALARVTTNPTRVRAYPCSGNDLPVEVLHVPMQG